MTENRDDSVRACNKCGSTTDLGMTCSGVRCSRCGCDEASVWGPLYVEISEETRRLWGPLTPAEHAAGRDKWER